jgi:DNA-binding HxlR family transcriptional regulator
MEDKQTCRMIDAYLSIFGSRWNLLIMNELFNSPKRFNELKRALSPITQTVLVRHLKTLEEMGMIERNVVADTPLSVYYSISKSGFAVIPSMVNLYGWIIEHVPGVKENEE